MTDDHRDRPGAPARPAPRPGADRPVLIELDAPGPSPADAPVVADDLPRGRAMQTAAILAARPPSRLRAWFWRLLAAIVLFVAGVAAWSFIDALLARNEWLGLAAMVLFGLFLAVCLGLAIREIAALARLEKLDTIHRDAAAARAAHDLPAARAVTDRIAALYAARDDTRWGRDALADRRGDMFDADALFDLAETTLLAPLDAAARAEVEAAARQVATITAFVPLALADVGAALAGNLRMIRRIAEIYGGRGGTLGAWRLTRAVFTHLVATGAVAVGDDLLQSVGGGHLLSRLSRRFGEGIVNGALTARVGIAAMEVCRPLPFHAERRPSVTRLLQRALTGMLPGSGKSE